MKANASIMPYFLLALLWQTLPLASGHSWPEALNLIDNQGTISGATGYVRNFVPRNATGFQGSELDSFQKTQTVPGALTCMSRQIQQVQSPGYPRLAASPGDRIALRYAENGHVTIEQVGRPPKGGPVYIFGTTDGTENPLLTDVMAWNAAGTGGNKKGQLLSTQNFDDGRCYEDNSSANSTARAAANPLNGQLALPDFSGMPCQNDFVVPSNAPVGKPYTIYWVWNFTMVDPPGQGVEIYSDCLDLDLNATSSGAANKAIGSPVYNKQQAPISAAVSTYFETMAAFATGAPESAPASTPSTAVASTPSPAPASTPSPASAPSSSLDLIAEPTNGGGIYVSAAQSASVVTVTDVVRITPSPAMEAVTVTVHVTENVNGQQPAAAPTSVTPSVVYKTVAVTVLLDGTKGPFSTITPKATDGAKKSPGPATSPITAQASTPSAAPSVQSASGQAIPLITVGSTGPVIVGIPPASAPVASAPVASALAASAPTTPAQAPTPPAASVPAAGTPTTLAQAPTPAAASAPAASAPTTPAQAPTPAAASPPAAGTPTTLATSSTPAAQAPAAAAVSAPVAGTPTTLVTSSTPAATGAVVPAFSGAGSEPSAAAQTSPTDAPCKNKRVVKKSKLFPWLNDNPHPPPRQAWAKYRRYVA